MFDEPGDYIFAGIFGCMFLLLAALFGAIVVDLSGYTCYARTKMMGLEAEHSIATGCMVKVSGQWLPVTAIVPMEREGKIIFVPNSRHQLEVITK
jgi:hypothetical protein